QSLVSQKFVPRHTVQHDGDSTDLRCPFDFFDGFCDITDGHQRGETNPALRDSGALTQKAVVGAQQGSLQLQVLSGGRQEKTGKYYLEIDLYLVHVLESGGNIGQLLRADALTLHARRFHQRGRAKYGSTLAEEFRIDFAIDEPDGVVFTVDRILI